MNQTLPTDLEERRRNCRSSQLAFNSWLRAKEEKSGHMLPVSQNRACTVVSKRIRIPWRISWMTGGGHEPGSTAGAQGIVSSQEKQVDKLPVLKVKHFTCTYRNIQWSVLIWVFNHKNVNKGVIRDDSLLRTGSLQLMTALLIHSHTISGVWGFLMLSNVFRWVMLTCIFSEAFLTYLIIF